MIRHMWQKQSIAVKLIAAFLVVILIPAFFLSFFYYNSSSSIIKQNVRESSLQITKQAANTLSYIFTVGSDTSELVYGDSAVQQTVIMDADPAAPNIEKKERNNILTDKLNNYVFSSSFVKIIYVLKEENTSWGSGTFSFYKWNKERKSELEWLKQAQEKDGELVWMGLQKDKYSGGGDNTELVLPVGRVLKDFETLNNIGYILVNLDGKNILSKINQLKLGQTGKFFVVNESGHIMIHPDVSRVGNQLKNADLYHSVVQDESAEFEYVHNNTNYYGVKQPLSNGWMIVGTVPVHEITEEMEKLHRLVLLSSIGLTIAAILIGLFIAGKITDPIKQLTTQMKNVEKGNLKARTNVVSDDEIGLMSKQFNTMICRVEDLMASVNDERSKKQQAELRAIKNRINPHFLFNTLSTIKWLIQFKQNEKANEAISALTRLLEANMGKKGNLITVAEELDILEKYLVILKIRYDREFHLDIEIDDKLLDFRIPRMLLQPIVENAIFHGIVPTDTTGLIQLKGEEEKSGSIRFIITDNGKGFDPSKLKQIKDIETSIQNGFVGIGLAHVYESIQLYYSPKSTMIVESQEGTGTQITLLLYPLKEGEEHV
ncbi:sensor histidine kinase [Fictibacillus terranigra]|uniref:Sensor histidine kinase n=1 Tax=Fictibacillus terranigra TaxID=3058424 RepID=A0ABT8EDA7_9BACL|nr:sensor histidine kinase [Fictibacillus sp. CENA-BCM004]MDN4075924.1 sensor histidine kinase [Fictibacillus sp. CENA-BCM004]